MLDIAPKYAIIPGYGVVIFAKDEKEQKVSTDIVTHTICAILTAEQLESWTSLKASDLFEMEYWELEQAKLKK
jgi:rhamnose utilization protein RhaD (predicted bifunctional aldolase and dehydrogenase)